MKKRYQKQIEELGFIRCLNCGHFAPAYIDMFKVERVILGFPISTISSGFILRCEHCHNEKIITKEEMLNLVRTSKTRMPVNLQQNVWKRIYKAHKRIAKNQQHSIQLTDFFNEVKNEVMVDLPYDVELSEINYIFNAYLTNLTIASKK